VKAHVATGVNGLPKLVLEHGSGSRAEVYLNGAQVTSWIPAGGHEMMFLSERAVFENGKAIRGGVPVVFPQFADTGPLPKHGWLRTSMWHLRDVPSQLVSATFEIEEDQHSMAIWPHPYHVELKLSLGKTFLEIELSVKNPGAEAFEFTCALHSYLSVGDVRNAEITGLNGSQYIDKVKRGVVTSENEQSVHITSQTDRVYMDAGHSLTLNDAARETRLAIKSSGFRDTVVWNPWEDGSSTIADMSKDDYRKMLCVEAATAVNPISLVPGDNWTGTQRFTVE
jgi:glucose-6-phosphate 1-epimerase